MIRVLSPIAALLVCTNTGYAATITVCASGCDYTSINAAIDAASDGDVVVLAAETYAEGEPISTDGKRIAIRGTVDKTGAPTSILDGSGFHRVVNCQNGETRLTRFENLVIRNGSEPTGGGMYVSADPTISNCVFRQNTSTGNGGGAHCFGGSPAFTGCEFLDNVSSSADGGAVWLEGSGVVLTDCTFRGNRAARDGGAIIVGDDGMPSLQGCDFAGNVATGEGGAILVNVVPEAFAIASNCTFTGNDAFLGGALAVGGGTVALSGGVGSGNTASGLGGFAFVDGGRLNAVDGVISDNTAVGFAGGIYAPGGEVAITATTVCGNSLPQLQAWTNLGGVLVCRSCDDCEDGVAAGVPCDTGIRGDFNCDGVYDQADYLAIQEDLGICPGDLDGDGRVDGADLGSIFVAWGMCP